MLMKSPLVLIFIFTLDSKEINGSQEKSKTHSLRMACSLHQYYLCQS